MPKLNLKVLLALAVMVPSTAHAAPTPAQRCEADVELASAKFAQCRLTAEARHSKSLDADKRTAALARCSEKLQQSFAKAVGRYGLNCTSVPVTEFDAYLKQCSDDAAAAAAGASFPDNAGDLASCNADLTICDGDLSTCTSDLTTCTTNLATAQSDLATYTGYLSACTGNLGTCTTNLASAESDLATCEGDLAACEAQPPGTARLLKTGQTADYGPGSDGAQQIGVTRNYVDNGDGTITDTQTGLMWEKKGLDGGIHDLSTTYSWSTGAPWHTTGTVFTVFLAMLNSGGGFAGHTDWRLPNLSELESIRYLQDVEDVPNIAPIFHNNTCSAGCSSISCSCTSPNYYWTSSTESYFPSEAWVVSGDTGDSTRYPKTLARHVRAVRTDW